MALSSKIKALCDGRNITIAFLEKELGFGNGSFRKSVDVGFSRICIIADYFGVPLDYFREDTQIVEPAAQALVNIYDSFGDEGREKLMSYAQDLYDTGRYIKNRKRKMVERNA